MMQTPVEAPTVSPKLERVATVLRLTGWLGFSLQAAFAAASILMLVFAIAGRNFTQATAPISPLPGAGVAVRQVTSSGLGIGVFWAVCGILALLFSVYLAFRQTRLAKRLRHPNPAVHPPRADVMKLLRLGVIVGFVGMLLTILGSGATLGVLLSKSIAQPQGVAIYDPTRIIRSLDIFVAMANMNGVAAHFIGAASSLALFNWLHRD